ncbi:MAG: hypothetical protein GY943_18165 [Chloroflexi bacterium]|nr:hypothetical protein [Chloroflexota bacterium]
MSSNHRPETSRSFFLGVDTGATKSHALIIDQDGQPLGFGGAGPGNWEVVGWESTAQILDTVIMQAVAEAGIERSQITAAGFGLAGYDWPEDRQPHLDIIQSIGITAPFEIYNDAFIGLPAGTDKGWGVVVSAGTSCNCYGRNLQGQIGRVGGASFFGENAGAGELVWQALQVIAYAWNQRGPTTHLTEAFLEATGAQDTPDLMAGIMRDRYTLTASLAPIIFEVANSGDKVALDLVRWAGKELAELAKSVIQQLDISQLAFDVVLSGSLYKGSPKIQQTMSRRIRRLAPQARCVRLDVPSVVGAVLLGAELGGADLAKIRTSLLQNMRQPTTIAFKKDLFI